MNLLSFAAENDFDHYDRSYYWFKCLLPHLWKGYYSFPLPLNSSSLRQSQFPSSREAKFELLPREIGKAEELKVMARIWNRFFSTNCFVRFI